MRMPSSPMANPKLAFINPNTTASGVDAASSEWFRPKTKRRRWSRSEHGTNRTAVARASSMDRTWCLIADEPSTHGSMGGTRLNAPVTAVAVADNGGYRFVASDGGVFSFGDASFYGSAGGTRLNASVTGVAAMPDGQGYWLVASDGGVFTYGSAGYFGSVPGQGITGQAPIVAITPTPTGSGYWIAGANGAVYTYGDARFLGAPNAGHLVAPVSGIAGS